jgi:peptide/nickel transport system substrate-binding protein
MAHPHAHGLAVDVLRDRNIVEEKTMFKSKGSWATIATFLVVVAMLLSACAAPQPQVVTQVVEKEVERVVEVEKEVTKVVEVEKQVEKIVVETVEVEVEREVARRLVGAWVDSVIVVEEPSSDAGVTRLEVGELDVYAYTISNPEIFRRVEESTALEYDRSFGSYNELSFNPVGPVFEGTGKLNPFSVPRMREAMNWLINREYITQEIMGGMGAPRWLPFNNASNDYAKLADVARKLEFTYAYDMDRASTVMAEEMEKLGATLVNGIWQYEGEPVEIIVLIRTEDERRDIGDYVANQLEDVGFTVTRDYKSAGDASPIWLRGNPGDGLFHIYTGGWITTVVPRDLADNFAFFYTDMGLPFPLWQNYTNDPEFYELAERLDNRDFTTLEERREMMARALELSFEDSVRIWLADRASITPRRAEVQVGADLYGGVSGSWLWAFTLQREGVAGGEMTIGMPSILTEPWNPIAGTNWIYDMMLVRSTGEMAHMPDPYTGLWWPQRMERGEVFIQEGLPVGKELGWVDLEFVSEIVVPEDAWADWDAAEQRFITVGEMHDEPITALRKSIVYYPADLYEKVKWHDGSAFSAADVVMGMILTFDRAKEDSPVFDQAAVASFTSFMSAFRGVRIVSTNPLVIETYSDLYNLDAELNVTSWWPYYAQGQGAWHQLALGLLAEEKEEAAYSAAKADELEVEWLSFIAGPTIAILDAQLQEALAGSYIPYQATLGEFVTAAEARARYENLRDWKAEYGHFWVGTGPFYLERAFPVEKTVSLKRNADYPDSSDKWVRFAEPMLAEVFVDGPSRVTIGAQAVFDIEVTFNNEPYAIRDIDQVRYLVFDATGELAIVGDAEAVDDGLWEVVLSASDTGNLPAGSNRLEVVVVSKRVAVPSSDALTFVTAQ